MPAEVIYDSARQVLAANDKIDQVRTDLTRRAIGHLSMRQAESLRERSAVTGASSIEHRLHWRLDVSFGEEPVPPAKGPQRRELQHPAANGPESAEEQHDGESGNQERTPADGWNEDYLTELLFGQ